MTYNYNQSNKGIADDNIDDTWTLVSTNKKSSWRSNHTNTMKSTKSSIYPKSGTGMEILTECEPKLNSEVGHISTHPYSSNNNRKKYKYNDNNSSKNIRDFRNTRDMRDTKYKTNRYENTNRSSRNKQHENYREGINWSSQVSHSVSAKHSTCKYNNMDNTDNTNNIDNIDNVYNVHNVDSVCDNDNDIIDDNDIVNYDDINDNEGNGSYNITMDIEKYKKDNYKKILCKNITSIGRCIYTNKCLYAHSLDEQNVEPIREISYNMIKKNEDLSLIDLTKNKQLYNDLLALSKICQHCEDGTCTGGYNCKHGACDKIYVICQTDLNKGTCEGGCGKIHLTKKGLVPYGVNIVKNLKANVTIPKATIINEEFFKQLNNNISKSQNDKDNTNISRTCPTNTLLTQGITKKNNHLQYNNQQNNTVYKYDSNTLKDVINIIDSNKSIKSIKSINSSESNDLSDSTESTSLNDSSDSSTWANIVKNDNPLQSIKMNMNKSNIRKYHNDSMDSDSSDDDLLVRLNNIKSSSDDLSFDASICRKEKLKKSIFKIDVMCI